MAKTNTKAKPKEESAEAVNEVPAKEAEAQAIPANVENLMRLYPQYKRFYVTAKGFLHPEGAPQWLVKDAVLYENKYYQNQ